jgi:hypothetical protein
MVRVNDVLRCAVENDYTHIQRVSDCMALVEVKLLLPIDRL